MNVEAVNADVSDGARPAAVVLREHRLRVVLDQIETTGVRKLPQPDDFRRMTEDVDGQDRARLRRDGTFDRGRIEAKIVRLDIGKDRDTSVKQRRHSSCR